MPHWTPRRSLPDQLVGRFHHFNIVHFDRSLGEHRYTPVIFAFRSELTGSPYGMPFLIKKLRECSDLGVEKAVAGDTARQKFYGYFIGANLLNGEFRRQSELCLVCRAVFRTQGGLLLGLGPADMCAGDEV